MKKYTYILILVLLLIIGNLIFIKHTKLFYEDKIAKLNNKISSFDEDKQSYENKIAKLNNKISSLDENKQSYEDKIAKLNNKISSFDKKDQFPKKLKQEAPININNNSNSNQSKGCEAGWKSWKNNLYDFKACLPKGWNGVHNGYGLRSEDLHDKTHGIGDTKLINNYIQLGTGNVDDFIISIYSSETETSSLTNKKTIHTEVGKYTIEDGYNDDGTYQISELILQRGQGTLVFVYNKHQNIHKIIINSIINYN